MRFEIFRVVNGGKHQIIYCALLFGRCIPKRSRQASLRIIVYDQDPFTSRSERGSKVYRCSRFSNATFLIGDCNNMLTHAEPS